MTESNSRPPERLLTLVRTLREMTAKHEQLLDHMAARLNELEQDAAALKTKCHALSIAATAAANHIGQFETELTHLVEHLSTEEQNNTE